MKKIITILLFLIPVLSFSAENENLLISEIIAGIDTYKNNTLVVNLRLKFAGKDFDNIVFYDSENIDVEFNISGKLKRKELAVHLTKIHEGMMYRVKFTVTGVEDFGGLMGDLLEFTPVILDKIPVK